jgi:hypothetical protein
MYTYLFNLLLEQAEHADVKPVGDSKHKLNLSTQTEFL